MADSNVAVTEGSGKNIDTRTNAGGDHRQVIVIGHESATDSVAAVQATDPSSSALGVVVREPNSTAIVSGLRDVRVQSIVDGTISLASGTDLDTITRVDRVHNLVDGTISTVSNITTGNLNTVTRVDRVMNVIDGTISTVTFVPTVQRVQNIVDGTLSVVTTVGRVNHLIDGTVTVTGITASAAVHILSTNGTMAVNIGTIAGSAAVYFSPSRPIVLADQQATASIFTVSGTTSTAGNNTLVSPSASYNFKVFAYSIQSTGLVSMAPRFSTGASAGATELWRPLITAVSTTSTPIGANLTVQPPGFIFATGTNVTLNLYLDTGSLVHYSVSYLKESA